MSLMSDIGTVIKNKFIVNDFSNQSSNLLTGGGTISVSSTWEVKWSARFIAIGNGRGAGLATEGYFAITMPALSTVITGVGGATNKTVTANGIPLGAWETLYYILPLGATNTTVNANFRVCSYTADINIPNNWIKICSKNNDDDGYVDFACGVSLRNNRNINTNLYDVLGEDVAGAVSSANILSSARTINGVSFNGSANINIENRLGTAVASAATTTIGTAGLGDYFHITGTTTITSFGATVAGTRRTLIFDGALTLTHNGTSLICPGAANIETAPGTVIEVIAETAANWRVVSITHPAVSLAELSYLDGTTSAIQTQLNNRYTKTVVDTANIFRADKYLSSQSIAKMIYDVEPKLVKIQYNNATDVNYEVLNYTGGNLTQVQHYIGSVLKGNTNLVYINNLLDSALFTAI